MKKSKKIIIGIDASRNRSGGAKAHLIGILSECDLAKHGIFQVHVWAYLSLLEQLPNYAWLIKHNPIALEQSLFKQLWWQANALADEVKLAGCDILFTSDASSLCKFKPTVVLSQDLLSYEPGVMSNYGFGFARLRLLAILAIQNLAFRRADGVIFLTQYASNIIQQSCGKLASSVCIPHGVDSAFNEVGKRVNWPENGERPIRCIYVSNAEMYKYQWNVIKAIALLRQKGYDLSLKLVGGGVGAAQKLIANTIYSLDPNDVFVKQLPFIPKEELPSLLAQSDLFVFASGCETFGITLLEGMAVGLPIACSDRSSLPETLKHGGIYFNPEDIDSIANSILEIIQTPSLRLTISQQAKAISEQYTWKHCANATWEFICKTYLENNK